MPIVLLLNGAAGGWDELAIALVALGVLWVAVKLAGRKPADEDDHDTDGLDDGEETARKGRDRDRTP